MQDQVLVLLSLYNGERYLEEQLISLSKQKKKASLLVRDDGSTDGSCEMLLRLCSELSVEVSLIKGENVGAAASFFLLLREALNYSHGYFAFCDQDDYWLSDKLSRAVDALGSIAGSPALYCSRQLYTNGALETIGKSKVPRQIGFGNALIENIAVGCTTVINRAALELLSQRPPPSCIMHDWWAYLVVTGVKGGRVIYDEIPSILYRQHGGNTVGVGIGFANTVRRRFRRHVLTKRPSKYSQVREFARRFESEIGKDQKRVLETFIHGEKSAVSRIRLAFSNQIWRQSFLDTLVFRVLALTGRL